RPASSFTSIDTTRAPSRAYARTVAAPMPLAPPVTTIRLPASCTSVVIAPGGGRAKADLNLTEPGSLARVRRPSHGDHRALRRTLAGVGVFPVILPPPVRLPPDVLDDAAGRAGLPLPRVDRAGLVLPVPARVRDSASRAPCLQRHRARSARARALRERRYD